MINFWILERRDNDSWHWVATWHSVAPLPFRNLRNKAVSLYGEFGDDLRLRPASKAEGQVILSLRAP